MKGTCDQCSKVFDVKLREKHHPKKIIETYFRCTHCKHKYVCFVTDPEVRQWQKEIKKIDSPFLKAGKQLQINNRMKELKEGVQRG